MAATGSLFQSLLNTAKPGLTSGLLTTGYGLLTGSPLPEALLYGAADTLASGATVSGVRALRPKGNRTVIENGVKRVEPGVSRLETPLNVTTSLLTSMGVSQLLGKGQPEPTNTSASQTRLQQNIQRDAINQYNAARQAGSDEYRSQVRNAFSPDTMFQMQGLEGSALLPQSYAMREELLKPTPINLAAFQNMMQLAGAT